MPLLEPRTDRDVAVFGAGPTGLVAAAAAELAGWRPTIFTDSRRPSGMFGAQYLHEPIPYVTPNAPVQISYTLRGDAETYRERVYGSKYFGTVSPEELTGSHDAWDIRETYVLLWERFQSVIVHARVQVSDMVFLQDHYAAVISAIPAKSICPGYNPLAKGSDQNGHWFREAEIWAAGDAPEIGIRLPYDCPDNTVICNGDPGGPAWYRMSRIYGRLTIEWPGDLAMKPPLNSVTKVAKPLATNCDCWTGPNYLRVGRYGKWQKEALVHQAYNETYEWLIKLAEES